MLCVAAHVYTSGIGNKGTGRGHGATRSPVTISALVQLAGVSVMGTRGWWWLWWPDEPTQCSDAQQPGQQLPSFIPYFKVKQRLKFVTNSTVCFSVRILIKAGRVRRGWRWEGVQANPSLLSAQPRLSPALQMSNCIQGCEKQSIFQRSPTVQNIKAKNMQITMESTVRASARLASCQKAISNIRARCTRH